MLISTQPISSSQLSMGTVEEASKATLSLLIELAGSQDRILAFSGETRETSYFVPTLFNSALLQEFSADSRPEEDVSILVIYFSLSRSLVPGLTNNNSNSSVRRETQSRKAVLCAKWSVISHGGGLSMTVSSQTYQGIF